MTSGTFSLHPTKSLNKLQNEGVLTAVEYPSNKIILCFEVPSTGEGHAHRLTIKSSHTRVAGAANGMHYSCRENNWRLVQSGNRPIEIGHVYIEATGVRVSMRAGCIKDAGPVGSRVRSTG
jgi:hypothetical protein